MATTWRRDAAPSSSDRIASGCDDAIRDLVRLVFDQGEVLGAVVGPSIGSGRSTREILNAIVRIDHLRQREPRSDHPAFDLVVAIARLIWMLSASNRLADIAFYENGVSRFTDNGLTVPGSSFGARLFDAQPGLDQVHAVVGRLREDSLSRRAMVSVYAPADAVRVSGDIPCLALMAFHIRGSALHTTSVMRSNNVYRLLPYNLFEQTFLSEMIASELGVDLGALTYHCVSAHIYDDENDAANSVSHARADRPVPLWDSMPREVSPFDQARRVCVLEARLRMNVLDKLSLEQFIADSSASLHDYWRDLLAVLTKYVVERREIGGATAVLADAGWTDQPKARSQVDI